MSYDTFLPLLKKTGSTLSPEKFHERINIVFHDFEADFYDEMHHDMRESLQQQIDLLVSDLFSSNQPTTKNLSLLDVGCGTGLSTQIVLNSKLGNYIESISLLDSSPKMLLKAEQKAAMWNKKYKLLNGYVIDVNQKFDVIIICSVLHHIPQLEAFLQQIDAILNPGGILIHLQDPNGDNLSDKTYLERISEYQSEQKSVKKKKKIVDLFPKNLRNFINRQIGRKTYIDKINDQLIKEKTIKNRMTADELWSVTDIHVETKNNNNKGISLQFLKNNLSNFELIKFRSYGFYGVLKSDLPENYKAKEETFIMQNQINGRNISCLWIKNLL